MKRRAVTFLAIVVAVSAEGALNAQPATKNVFPAPGLTTPIGIAYSPFVNKLLVTQPFCGTVSGTNATGFNIAGVDQAGNLTTFATLPAVPLSSNQSFGHNTSPFNQCFEDYIAVSPGLGGFPANQVYVTQGQSVVQIPPGGGAATPFVSGLLTTDTESGIAFDTVGTFCNDMIVTGANGRIYVINSAGVATLYATVSATIALPGGVAAESAIVAPTTFTPYGGYLLVGIENDTNGPGIAAIQPPTACSAGVPTIPNGGSPLQYRINNQPSPEQLLAVPASATSCEFGSGNSAGSFFSVTYTSPVVIPNLINPYQIVAYPASNFSGKVGDIMVPNEGQSVSAPTSPKTDYLSPGLGGLGSLVPNTLFDSGLGAPTFAQQEGVTFVGCPINLGCVLTPGGYKNNFNSKVTPLIIGGILYNATEVTTIISTGGGGLNALGRSLATALLNVQYGAFAPVSVKDAIAQAQTLIQSVTKDVGKTIFTASAPNGFGSSLNDILDAFNNGSAGQQECTK